MKPDYMVLLHIARLIAKHPEKMRQFMTMVSITTHLTSDSWLRITFELYSNHIARALIEGTWSGMTITYDTWTDELTRKKRGEEPLYVTGGQCESLDIDRILEERFSDCLSQ